MLCVRWYGLATGLVLVPLLPAEKKNGACSVLDVMSVEHKGQKRKLLLTEDETFYKLRRSNLENIVKPVQCV